MTAAGLASSTASATAATRAAKRCAAALWSVAVLAVGFGLWAVLRDPGPPAYYVVKWPESGKCTVTRERPGQTGVRILWFSTLEQSAERKTRELRENLRCA